KTCRKASLLLWLTSHTLCSKCGKASHLKYHKYCYHCLRRAKGRSQLPKFGRRALNLHLCSKCQQHLRLRYHAYCRDCALKSNRDWKHANGGNWKGLTPEQRRKAVARRYVKTRIDRGHMIRKPCEVCGHPKSEAHHYHGYDTEHALDVRWLCKPHHDEAERMLKSQLTEQPVLL